MKPGHKTKQTENARAAVARLENTLYAHYTKTDIFFYINFSLSSILCFKHLETLALPQDIHTARKMRQKTCRQAAKMKLNAKIVRAEKRR